VLSIPFLSTKMSHHMSMKRLLADGEDFITCDDIREQVEGVLENILLKVTCQ